MTDKLTQRIGTLSMVAVMSLSLLASPVLGEQGGFETRQAYDTMLEKYLASYEPSGRTGSLAWNRSYVMQSLLQMYRATGDTTYLDHLIMLADDALSFRDSERGLTDYRGRTTPGWAAGEHYSIGEIVLRDTNDRPALYVRTAIYGYNNLTQVTIEPAPADADDQTFTVRVRNERYDLDERFDGLTMNPDSPRYAPKVLNSSSSAAPNSTRLFVRDVREGGKAAVPLAPIQTTLGPSRYLWPVHQGMITSPMVAFARLVHETPALASQPRYRQKAETYVEVAESIMLLFEELWRENDKGEGWYIVERGAPIWFDGADLPVNQFLAVGRTLVHLSHVSTDPRWADRVRKLATTFKNDLTYVEETGAYTWSYWWGGGLVYNGWSAEDDVSDHAIVQLPSQVAEDLSHGCIDIHFAWLCAREGIVFDERDIQRFANTFLEHLVVHEPDGSITLEERVDGSGRRSRMDKQARAWALMATADPRVFTAFQTLNADVEWTGYALSMLTSAHMNWLAPQMPQDAVQPPAALPLTDEER